MTTPSSPDKRFTVAALYQFTPLEDRAAIRASLHACAERNGVKGTLLLAAEGLNGTIAGMADGIAEVLACIRALPGCETIEVKFSHAETMPFRKLKVRLKKEIVTMGQPDIDPVGSVGTYVAPGDWNALIDDPDTIVIDTRNDYEVAIGTFEGAIDPETASFRDFPQWFRNRRAELLEGEKPPKVAMFCTGGIRCEKATAFLKQEGVDEVYHLKGGILSYLEQVPETDSRWTGECFVFDERVGVKHGLEIGEHSLCRACRRPVSPEGRQSVRFVPGISCPACHDERTDEQRARYAERQRQSELSAGRAKGESDHADR